MTISALETELGRCIFREANDAFLVVNPVDLRLIDANPAAQRITGMRKKAILGLTLDQLLAAPDNSALNELMNACRTTIIYSSSDDFQLISPEGARRHVQVTVSRLHVEPEPLGLLILRDVTKQKLAESALRDNEALFRSLAEDLPLGLFLVDLSKPAVSTPIEFVNDAAGRLWNRRREEMIGRGFADLGDDSAAASWSDRAMRAYNGEAFFFLCRLQRANGSTWPAEVSIRKIMTRNRPLGLVLVHDLSEREKVESERAELERKALEAQKYESLGLLAAGVAHGFTDLLTGVLGHLDLARHELPLFSQPRTHLDQIEEVTLQAADLCKQMLAYAGQGRYTRERIDVSTIVRDTATLLRYSLSRALELDLKLTSVEAVGDAAQIGQAIMNLILNASQAIGSRPGAITLATDRVPLSREQLNLLTNGRTLPPGDFARILISDNGCGIAPMAVPRIFEPFFSSGFTGRGLGLAAVLGIMRGHHGCIGVESTDAGSNFSLYFPTAVEKK